MEMEEQEAVIHRNGYNVVRRRKKLLLSKCIYFLDH